MNLPVAGSRRVWRSLRVLQTRCIASAFAAVATLAVQPQAAEAGEPWTIIPPVFFIENDSFFHGPDRHYTSGLYASATSGRDAHCGSCDALARLFMLPSRGGPFYRYGFFAGQSMFSPEDLSRSPPDPKDRPYAGWLYVGAELYRESGNVLDRTEVAAGMVGPLSGADAIQRWWHALHWFGGVPPAGWHSQIANEPGLLLGGQRIWRFGFASNPIAAEILPEITASVGNVFTYAGAGATIRFGQGLHADWGPPRIRPALAGSSFVNFRDVSGMAWYLFAGLETRVMLRNITLDGNTFQQSPNVAKRPIVADLNVGAALLFHFAAVHATYVVRSREFKNQDSPDRFLSLSVSVPL